MTSRHFVEREILPIITEVRTIFIYLVLYHEKVVLATRRTATNIKLFRHENWLVKELNYATVIKIGCDIIHRGF